MQGFFVEHNKRIRELRDFLELGRAAFAEKTGIKKKTLENLELEKQEVYAWHIEAIGKRWPQFRLWLQYGEADPDSGQTSPEIEQIRRDSTTTGRAAS